MHTAPHSTEPKYSVFLLAIRPKTLPASISPVILGTATVPFDQINWLLALCCLSCALFLQITVNLANDYFDAKSGVDTQRRLGPIRVTQSGLASPTAVAVGIAFFTALSIVPGVILATHSDITLLAVGLVCILAALGYSGGPYPLASNGLGEFAVLVFFGWVAVMGSAYVHTHQISLNLFLLANALGVILASIMLVNNIRDIPTDSKAGKHTLAVLLGEAASKQLYAFLLSTTLIFHLIVFLILKQNLLIALAPMVLFTPFAIRACRRLYRYNGSKLNELLAETSVLGLIYSIPTSVLLALSH